MTRRNGENNGKDKKKPAASGNGHKKNAPFAGHIPSSDRLSENGRHPIRYEGPVASGATTDMTCESEGQGIEGQGMESLAGISGESQPPQIPCTIKTPFSLKEADDKEKRDEELLVLTHMVDLLLMHDSGRRLQLLIDKEDAEKVSEELRAVAGNPDDVHKVVAQRVAGCSTEDLDKACSDENYAKELGLETGAQVKTDCEYWEQQNQAVDEKTAMVLRKAETAIERLS